MRSRELTLTTVPLNQRSSVSVTEDGTRGPCIKHWHAKRRVKISGSADGSLGSFAPCVCLQPAPLTTQFRLGGVWRLMKGWGTESRLVRVTHQIRWFLTSRGVADQGCEVGLTAANKKVCKKLPPTQSASGRQPLQRKGLSCGSLNVLSNRSHTTRVRQHLEKI